MILIFRLPSRAARKALQFPPCLGPTSTVGPVARSRETTTARLSRRIDPARLTRVKRYSLRAHGPSIRIMFTP
jgi:hypothetical protein